MGNEHRHFISLLSSFLKLEDGYNSTNTNSRSQSRRIPCYWWFLLTLDRYAQVCKYAFESIWRTSALDLPILATHHELHSLWVMWSGRKKCNCLDISWVDLTSKSDKWKLNKSINSATSHSHFICLSLKSQLSRTVQQKQIRCDINSQFGHGDLLEGRVGLLAKRINPCFVFTSVLQPHSSMPQCLL